MTKGEVTFGASESDDIESPHTIQERQMRQIEFQRLSQELQRARTELREERNRHRELYDSAPVGCLSVDSNGCVVAVNLTMAALLGVDRSLIVDRPLATFLNAGSRETLARLLAQVAANGGGPECDLELASRLHVIIRARGIDTVENGDTDRAVASIAILDVTERRRAEGRVHSVEWMTQATLDSLSAHICVLDRNGNIVGVNRRWHEFAEANGASLELSNGHANYLAVCDAAAGLSSELAVEAGAAIRALIDGRRATFELEYPCDSPTEQRWFVAQGTAFDTPDGRFVVISHSDISARRRAELQVHASDARFRCVVESAMDGIIGIDQNQNIVILNTAAERMFGYAADDLIGVPLAQLVPRRFRTDHKTAIDAFSPRQRDARSMAGKRRVRALHADGHEFPIEASIASVAVGRTHMSIAIVRDVTDRVQVEDELRDSLRFNRQILESIGEGLAVFDPSSRILAWNRALTEMIGISEVVAKGRSLQDAIPPLAEVADPYLRRALAGETVACDTMIAGDCGSLQRPPTPHADARSDNAERTWFHVTFAPLRDQEGLIGGAVMLLVDLTALKRSQDSLARSTERLRRLGLHIEHAREDERRRVARELHDELGSALTALRMRLRNARTEVAGDSPAIATQLDQVLEIVDAAEKSTRRIMNDLRPHVLDNLGVWAAIQRMGEQFCSHAGIPCAVEVDAQLESLPLRTGVATMLFRVTQEALTNVMRHAGATRVEVEARLAGGFVEMEVRDDGKGASLDRLLNSDSHGLLGMKERVEEHQGALRVFSKVREGTRIVVTVPHATGDGDAACIGGAPLSTDKCRDE